MIGLSSGGKTGRVVIIIHPGFRLFFLNPSRYCILLIVASFLSPFSFSALFLNFPISFSKSKFSSNFLIASAPIIASKKSKSLSSKSIYSSSESTVPTFNFSITRRTFVYADSNSSSLSANSLLTFANPCFLLCSI